MGVETNRQYFRKLFYDEGVTEDKDKAYIYINEITFLILTKSSIFLRQTENFTILTFKDFIIHKKYKCSKKRIFAARQLYAGLTSRW